MRQETFLQIAVVEGKSASDFESKFNSKIRELAANGFSVDKDGIDIIGKTYVAVIPYIVTEKYVNSVKDEFHAEGIYFHCRNCPHMEDPEDGRVKHVKSILPNVCEQR